MTYTITQDCISCQRCLAACPTGAIETDSTAFWIEVARCNQCQGSYGVPQCWSVCPTNDGCVPLTTTAVALPHSDYWESWFATYTRLVARLTTPAPSGYWRSWFDTYANALTTLHIQEQRS